MDGFMPDRLERATKLVGDAVGTVETATAAAGSRLKQGLKKAVTAIEATKNAELVKKQTGPLVDKATGKAKSQKRTSKKQAAATRKAGQAKKTAKKKTTGAKKAAKKRTSGAKKTAKKGATAAKRKTTGAEKRAPRHPRGRLTRKARRRPAKPRPPTVLAPKMPRRRRRLRGRAEIVRPRGTRRVQAPAVARERRPPKPLQPCVPPRAAPHRRRHPLRLPSSGRPPTRSDGLRALWVAAILAEPST